MPVKVDPPNNITQTAQLTGLSRQGVYDAIDRGELVTEELAGHPIVRLSVIKKYKRKRDQNGTKKRGPKPKVKRTKSK